MATKKSAGTPEENDAMARFLSKRNITDTKEVSSSSWKWEEGLPKYFKVLGLPIKQDKRAGISKEPPFTCPVKDLESGDHKTLIINTMLLNQFASYPGDTLIGRCFVSIMYPAPEGKTWKRFETREVPDPNPEAE